MSNSKARIISDILDENGLIKADALSITDESGTLGIPAVDGLQPALDDKVDKVAGKGLSTEDYTTAEKNKLSGIEAGAEVNTVTSVAAKTGAVTLNKSDVGLGNVDNTSDLNKPISTATQNALDAKVAITDIVNNLTSNNGDKPLSANQGLILKGFIDNINAVLQSDDTTLDELQEIVDFIKQNRQDLDTLGISNIAGLQAALDTKVDKITGKGLSTEDYTTAEKNKLAGIEAGAQVNVGTNLGSSGTGGTRTITSSTGSNTSITYTKGDIGLGNVDNTSDANKPISTATQSALDGKENAFTKNTAFNKNFGTAANTVTQGNDSRLSNSREWTASTISQAEAEAGTATTRRAFTAQRVFQAIVAWWNGSSDKSKLDGIEAGAQVNVGTNLGQGGSGNSRTITSSTGNNVTVSTATTSNAGFMSTGDKSKLDGIAAGAQVNVGTNLGYTASTRVLTSSTGSNVTLPQVTTSADGLMIAADKSKLDGIAAGAQVNTVTSVNSKTGAVSLTAADVDALRLFTGGSINANAANGTGLFQGSTGGWTNRGPAGNNAGALLSINTHPGNYYSQLWFDTAGGGIYHRTANNVLPTSAWDRLVTNSGTWGINITGSASTATTLQTARTINGTSFNGSANITTANWGTARTLTIGSTGKSVNGSGNVSWSLAEIGAAAASHTHSGLLHRGTFFNNANDALTEGTYGFGGTLTNYPYASGFGKLTVTVNDGGTHNNTNNWIWQRIQDTSGRHYSRYKVNTGGWTGWVHESTGSNWIGNAGTVTNGVYTAGNQTIGGVKTFGSAGTAFVVNDNSVFAMPGGGGKGTNGAPAGQYPLRAYESFGWNFTLQTGTSQPSGFRVQPPTSTSNSSPAYFVVLNTGNVGIGTSSPASQLDVAGDGVFRPSAGSTTRVGITSSSDVPRIDFVNSGTFNMEIGYRGSSAPGRQNSGEIRVVTANPLSFFTTNIERMRIVSNGNVGIGTDSPSSRLHINGAASETNGLAQINNTHSTGGTIFPALRVLNDRGNHSFGTVAEFRISNTSDVDRPAVIFSKGGTNNNWAIGMGVHTNNTDSFSIGHRSAYPFANFATSYLTIQTTGNVGIGTTSPSQRLHVVGNILASGDITAFSDVTLKDNIEVIPNAVEKILQCRGVTYTRKDEENKTKRHSGVIAQEVEAVLPEVVQTNQDGIKSVAYGNMVGLLIEAIKEQQTQIELLKSEISGLKEKLND